MFYNSVLHNVLEILTAANRNRQLLTIFSQKLSKVYELNFNLTWKAEFFVPGIFSINKLKSYIPYMICDPVKIDKITFYFTAFTLKIWLR